MRKMPLPNLNLDDKTFKELVEDAKKHIPIYAPKWTDHSIHDPGITIIELFAWLTEMQLYYLSRITPENKIKFLKILGNELTSEENFGENTIITLEKIEEELLNERKNIEKIYSAVTPEDYEYLALKTPNVKIARVKAISTSQNIMKIIIVPKENNENLPQENIFTPTKEDIENVYSYLDKFRLISTPLYVCGAEIVKISISSELIMEYGYDKEKIILNAENSLKSFLNPITGSFTKKGWSFGRSVFKSDIYKILNNIEGIDSVLKINIHTNSKYEYDGEKLYIPKEGLIYSENHFITVFNQDNYCIGVNSHGR